MSTQLASRVSHRTAEIRSGVRAVRVVRSVWRVSTTRRKPRQDGQRATERNRLELDVADIRTAREKTAVIAEKVVERQSKAGNNRRRASSLNGSEADSA